jgi:hypothetical protein
VCDDIQSSTLFIFIYLMQKKDQYKKIGAFKCEFSNSKDLIDGNKRVYLLDGYIDYLESGAKMLTGKVPKMVIELTYLNSIFTQKKGEGKLELLIKSWTKGQGESLNTANTYAKVKLLDNKGDYVDNAKTKADKLDEELLLGDQKLI